MMADSDTATRKRKVAVKRTIGLLFHSNALDLNQACALYKFDFDVSSSSDGVVVEAENNQLLPPIATFFKHDFGHIIDDVGCGIIGSKIFLYPNWYTRPSHVTISSLPPPTPLRFDFLNNQTDALIKPPPTPKVSPFVIPIRGKLYVLSVSAAALLHILDPAFEVYDPTTESWEPLPHPPFYDVPRPDCPVYGYTVLITPDKDQVFIIVMGIFDEYGTAGFYSYNLQTRVWKRVPVSKGVKYPSWLGEAVVVGGHVYAYTMTRAYLESFPISYCEKTDNISLGEPFKVTGLRMNQVPQEFIMGVETGAIVNIGDRMLCVVYTCFPYKIPSQYVLVSIIQIRENEPKCCETLTSLTFSLPKLTEEHLANTLMLTSCFALPPDVTSFMEQIEEGRDRKHRVVNYNIDVKGSGDNSSMCH